MTVTRDIRRDSRVTVTESARDIGRDVRRDVRRESRDPDPTPPYPTRPMSVLALGSSVKQVQEEPHLGAMAALGIGRDA